MDNNAWHGADYNHIQRAQAIHYAALVAGHGHAQRYAYYGRNEPAYEIEQERIGYFFAQNG